MNVKPRKLHVTMALRRILLLQVSGKRARPNVVELT